MTVLLESEVPIKDENGKWHLCTPRLIDVRGGKNVGYYTMGGLELKREPLHRYMNRVSRRKTNKNDSEPVGGNK